MYGAASRQPGAHRPPDGAIARGSAARRVLPSVFPLFAIGLALTLLSGCHEVTEYSSQEQEYGVHIVSTDDLTLHGTLRGFQGARSICSTGETRFLVACNTGQLFTVSSSELVIEKVQEIGLPFSPGYNSMIRANDGSVYLITAYSQIADYSVAVGAVMEEFMAGPSPVALCRSPTRDSIYVADALDSRIREVATLGNTVTREKQLSGTPAALSPFDEARDMVLVAGSSPCFLDMETFSLLPVPGGAAGSVDVASLPDTAFCCLVCPDYQSSSGRAVLAWGDQPHFMDAITIVLEGDPLAVCSTYPAHEFFVVSYLGNGTSRLYVIDFYTLEVTDQLDLSGYPWDVVSHSNGEYVLLLTTEV